jgi:hypothetical protein
MDARADAISYREPLVLGNLLGARLGSGTPPSSRAFSDTVHLARAILHLFVVDADRRGARLAIVKLGSACSRSAILACLQSAAPLAHRVQLTRPIDAIVRSHERHPLTPSRGVTERGRAEAKTLACASWAQTQVDYGLFAGPERDFAALSAAMGLPPPTQSQLAAMEAEAALDAKTGDQHKSRA